MVGAILDNSVRNRYTEEMVPAIHYALHSDGGRSLGKERPGRFWVNGFCKNVTRSD
ncbi:MULTISPECIES: hypothetical protein [unclassified Paenibacillus]|uniref:hypothetical protein n=1 Tax=unclassified Paenibacillus TaxID=185978 RepID=UPI0016425B80|nr:hypothetical protein [Paenibacillus sp. 32O-W]